MDRLSEFINKSKRVHGNKYDYSKVEYVNSQTKVCIICPIHGEFWQTPANHVHGHGCPFCSVENVHLQQKSNSKEFIDKAKKIHGNKYTYSHVNYINNETKVLITCPIHGDFEQKPANHLSGQGCPKCGKISMANKQSMTKDEFVSRCNLKYKNFYNYDKVEYCGCFNKIVITCPIHGDFEQTPASHLHNSGCPKCGRIRSNNSIKLTRDEFIEKSKSIHGDYYDYSKVNYVNYDTKVCIICPKHGEFWQTPDSHLQGRGCRLCNKSISKKEKELTDIINNEFNLKTVNGDRSIINPYELDIFIPDKKIAIEYNGILWHSEEYGKDKYYHVNKLNTCKNRGVKLIQIFEDEYISHKEIVLNKLKHILGIQNNNKKIPGRKCIVVEINNKISKEFLNKYHIQGFSRSTVYLGAYYNDELVAVMTFLKMNDGCYELNRFASNYNYICQGVGGKLFSYFIKNYNPEKIKSFADRRWTINEDNNVYLKLGFKFDKYTPPDYSYFLQKDGLIRQHKFNFRKKALNKKYGFSLEMSEDEMIKKLGCKKIWNCGLIKYVWEK